MAGGEKGICQHLKRFFLRQTLLQSLKRFSERKLLNSPLEGWIKTIGVMQTCLKMDGEKEWITWHSIGIKRNQFFQTNFCAYGEAKQLAEKQDLNYIYIDLFLNAF